MAPWDDFDAIFSFNRNFVYDGKVIEQIISNRRALENQLFADRLLGLLGVRAGELGTSMATECILMPVALQ